MKNGKGSIPILKTEAQLRSFIHRKTIKVTLEEYDTWAESDTSNKIFLDGKKVVEKIWYSENWGSNVTEYVRVIALYLPRKTGAARGRNPNRYGGCIYPHI